MLGFQAAGAAPIVRGERVEAPETVATAIRIGNPASWKAANAARDDSGGLIDLVTDEEIMEVCRGKLGGFERPRSVDFIDALPRTASGKVLKRDLREPYWEGHDRRVAGA